MGLRCGILCARRIDLHALPAMHCIRLHGYLPTQRHATELYTRAHPELYMYTCVGVHSRRVVCVYVYTCGCALTQSCSYGTPYACPLLLGCILITNTLSKECTRCLRNVNGGWRCTHDAPRTTSSALVSTSSAA